MWNCLNVTSSVLNPAIGTFLLRIFVGGRLIYGVIDNVLSWEKMVEFSVFLEQHQFPFPLLAAVASVVIQFVGALMILIGFKTKIWAILLVLNFLIALVFVHFQVGDTVESMTPALALLFICLSLVFTGPGKFSVDYGSGTFRGNLKY